MVSYDQCDTCDSKVKMEFFEKWSTLLLNLMQKNNKENAYAALGQS